MPPSEATFFFPSQGKKINFNLEELGKHELEKCARQHVNLQHQTNIWHTFFLVPKLQHGEKNGYLLYTLT